MQVACVLITHLPVKAELQRRPQLRGHPVVVVETAGSQQRVLDHSPEARGVAWGMPLQEAAARCPEAVLLPADHAHYGAVFGGLVVALERRSPLVEPADLGCVYLGLDGLEEMYGGEAKLIASLLQAVPQAFNPRIGVAEGKFPAYVAAVTCGGGQAARVPQHVAGFLKEHSIDLLPLSWEDRQRLHGFGLHTLGQVAALPVGALQAQLGFPGQTAWQLANGIDPSPLVPHRREPEVRESLSFLSPTVTCQALLTGVATLLGRAFARREVRDRYVRAAVLEGGVRRRPPWTRRVVFKEPVVSPERALRVIRPVLESAALPGPLEDLSLTLAGFTGQPGLQTSLFPEVRRREQLREMVRRLETQLGGKPPIFQVKEVEPWSRIPERRRALVPFDP